MYELKDIDIYVMSCNRSSLLDLMIQSLGVNVPLSKIKISENSSDENERVKILKKYKECNIIERSSLQPIDHFIKILDECKNKFCVILHDDDQVHKNFIQEIIKLINKGSYCAYAFNAVISPGNKKFINDKETFLTLNSPGELIKRYAKLGEKGFAPFPSYIYNMEVLDSLRPNILHGGKHSDASFLINILKKGPILWSTNVCMTYVLHSANDSVTRSQRDRFLLTKFLKINVDNKDDIKDLRMDTIYGWMKLKSSSKLYLLYKLTKRFGFHYYSYFGRKLLSKYKI